MQTAIARWQEIVRARARQMDAAYERLGRSSADFWDRRATSFHRATQARTIGDPFYEHVRSHLTPESTLLDVGAGTGRFSLALAPFARQVIALEPNGSMLSFLRAAMEERGISNITPVQSRWEDASPDLRADVVLCSHVLYPLGEIEPFVRKLAQASVRSCFISLRATHIDALTAPFWQHFHGDERQMAPSYIHALDVLYEMGIYAQVEVNKAPYALQYPTPQDAEHELIEQLILEDTSSTREELRRLLKSWLQQQQDGTWSSPQHEMVSAILWWENHL